MITGVRLVCLALLAISVSACMRQPPSGPIGESIGANRYVVGVPYQINGRWYYPREDFSYDETGVASFYGGESRGVDFHGRRTANGEVYDMNRMTAAHTTLPLPTVVRVTRLDNGRSVVVRVNDRGPFIDGRIVDLSRRAAQLLGMEGRGTAQVRVQVMADESRRLRDELIAGRPPPDIAQLVQVASPGPGDSGPITIATLVERQNGTGAPASVAAAPPVVADAPPALALPAATANAAVPAVPVPGETVQVQPLPAPAAASNQARPAIALRPAGAPSATGTMYVQAGSFTSAENAERLRQRVQAHGRVHVSAIRVNGQNFYRVRIGPVASSDEATRLRERIIGVAPEARVVVD